MGIDATIRDAKDADTIVAELSEHGNIAKYAISYDMNLSGQKVLDLTNPQIASEFNIYKGVSKHWGNCTN